jgi:signal transduction histidine kinase
MLMPAPYAANHDEYIGRYLQTRVPHVIGVGREASGRRKNGEIFPLELSVGAINELGLFAGIIRDVSERKRLEEELLRAVAEQQRCIGQDLHDHTGQELTALLLTVDTILEDLEAGTPPDLQLIRRLREGLQRVASQVRDYSRGLLPVEVDSEGLPAALAELARNVSGMHNIECSFASVGDVRIYDNTVATHLFRVAQEAVSNAVRHAEPNHISISLRPADGGVVLRIRDDGKGFGKSPVNSTGMGLRIMRHRASLIHGQLAVEPLGERGTEVRCTVMTGD